MSAANAGEQRAPWKHDSEAESCDRCKSSFNLLRRRHHCRRCGGIFCDTCSNEKVAGISGYGEGKHRICLICKGTTALSGTLKPTRLRERKICVVGAPGVGKTALVTQLIEKTFSEDAGPGAASAQQQPSAAPSAAAQPATTRSRTMKSRGAEYQLSILDATAQAAGETFQPVYSIGTAAYCIVFALDDRASFSAVRSIRDRILDCGGFDTPLVLVGNKDDRGGRAVAPEEVAQLAAEWRVPYVELSASRNADVEELFATLLKDIVARDVA